MAIHGDTEVPDMQSHFAGRDSALGLAPSTSAASAASKAPTLAYNSSNAASGSTPSASIAVIPLTPHLEH